MFISFARQIMTNDSSASYSLILLVCPETKRALFPCTIQEAEQRAGTELLPRRDALNARGEVSKPVGKTPHVLLREDYACAYPIVDGIPILLVPEALRPLNLLYDVDLTKPQYAEAYEEMEYYNKVAILESKDILKSEAYFVIAPSIGASEQEIHNFPHPKERWIDATYDCMAQWNAYTYLGTIKNKQIVQLGGKGSHAVKFLLAGASETWAITPMLGEALCARALADAVGVGASIRCVVAVAEELPIQSETIDAVYSGGCLHHMQTELALPEAARILRKGGKFAAIDPWRAPLYAIGTKILGKREPSVYCKPLNKKRMIPLYTAFREAQVELHGTLTRYPLLALRKFGVESSLATTWNFMKVDDALCSLIPGMRSMGSSVAVLGGK